LQALFIFTNAKVRHAFQLIVSTVHFYGTVVYFALPYYMGTWNTVFPKIDFEWYMAVGATNGVWLIVPLFCIMQSVCAFSCGGDAVKKTKKD